MKSVVEWHCRLLASWPSSLPESLNQNRVRRCRVLGCCNFTVARQKLDKPGTMDDGRRFRIFLTDVKIGVSSKRREGMATATPPERTLRLELFPYQAGQTS